MASENDPMSQLHFELKSQKLRSLDLPVEVRKPNLALVARSVISQPINIAPGTYHVSVKLPDGQELFSEVKVGKRPDTKVVLELEQEDEDEPLHIPEIQTKGGLELKGSSNYAVEAASYGIANFLIGNRISGAIAGGAFAGLFSSQLEILGTSTPATARIRAFTGNLLKSDYKAIDTGNWKLRSVEKDGVRQFYIRGLNGFQLVQLIQPGQPALNVALPASDYSGCFLLLTRLIDGFYSVDVHLENKSADLLLQYLEQGDVQQAMSVATSDALSAEKLLERKKGDPIAAAVGAYTLLRFGELERLHNWTENLRNWFKWLPDGVAIRGEHLARLGEHEQALTVLLDLPNRGLPIFSSGLSYGINRLRFYQSFGERHFQKAKLEKAQAVLEQLQSLAAFVDFRRPLLTFTGIDPSKPNDVRIGEDEDIAIYGGIDVTEYGGS